MNNNILDDEIQKYIKNNEHKNITEIILGKTEFQQVSTKELAQQIKGKQIAKNKFPFLYKSSNIYYPVSISLEQSSSETTAKYKKEIIKNINERKIGIDLTGGLGIDSFFLSDNFKEYYFIEPNPELLDIVKNNFSVLKKEIKYFNQTAEEFLSENKLHFDFIYIDPSRRDSDNNKKFKLEDLSPNIISLKEILLQISNNVLIKLSPFLDLQQIINQIFPSEIIIVSLKNEVKEILCKLNNHTENPLIKCVNLETSQSEFNFLWEEEKKFEILNYKEPENYIYIPNSSILKSGAFKLITERYNILKLSNNSHIYTSENYINDFPGRIFKILDINFDIKKSKDKKFNIISKNYRFKPEEIKKRYKIVEGGEKFLLFTKSEHKYYTILMNLL